MEGVIVVGTSVVVVGAVEVVTTCVVDVGALVVVSGIVVAMLSGKGFWAGVGKGHG